MSRNHIELKKRNKVSGCSKSEKKIWKECTLDYGEDFFRRRFRIYLYIARREILME